MIFRNILLDSKGFELPIAFVFVHDYSQLITYSECTLRLVIELHNIPVKLKLYIFVSPYIVRRTNYSKKVPSVAHISFQKHDNLCTAATDFALLYTCSEQKFSSCVQIKFYVSLYFVYLNSFFLLVFAILILLLLYYKL